MVRLELKNWLDLKNLTRITEKIRMKEVLLGEGNDKLANHLISIGTQILQSNRNPSIFTLLGYLQADKESEKYWAQINETMGVFAGKWSQLDLETGVSL